MNDIQLSEDFWLREFLRSETAARKGRDIVAGEFEQQNLRRLCVDVLQPIRSSLGRVVTILSGLRPVWLNNEVGGSRTSAHIYGMAADFVVAGMTPRETCLWIEQKQGTPPPFEQLILEFDRWVHISIPTVGAKPKREILTAKREYGRTIYLLGIVA